MRKYLSGIVLSFILFAVTSCDDEINNKIAVVGVTLSESSKTINVGDTFTLTAIVEPDDADEKGVTWTSSNSNVASVLDGTVVGVSDGFAIITVKTDEGDKTATCQVTVTADDNGGNNGGDDDEPDLEDVYMLDISAESDWDYLILGNDGSSILLNVNENTGMPARLYCKPDKNSDEGLILLIKENGLPDLLIIEDYILYFGNFRDNKFDMALLKPDNSIEFFHDLVSDTHWDSYLKTVSLRSGSTNDLVKALKNIVGVAMCAGAAAVTVFVPPTAALATKVCVSAAISLLVDYVVPIFVDDLTANGFGFLTDFMDCASDPVWGIHSCISVFISIYADTQYNQAIDLVGMKNSALAEAIKAIEGENGNGDELFLAPIESPEAGSVAIPDKATLEKIGKDPNYSLNGKYHLTANIDLSGTPWMPIGTSSSPFRGVFDGQGHVIGNLKIEGDYEFAGLFGCIDGATIRNVGLDDTEIVISRSSNVYVGGICGYSENSSKTVNCFSKGKLSATSSSNNVYIGGICGYHGDFGSALISNCYVTGEVAAAAKNSVFSGGIIGFYKGSNLYSNYTVTNCFNKSSLSVNSASSAAYVGGIYGYGYVFMSGSRISINTCFNTGSIIVANADNTYTGGICSRRNTVNDCYNSGAISVETVYSSYAGGICGESSDVENCNNSGLVLVLSHSRNAYAGGIMGSNGSVNNCHNTGLITAVAASTTYAGGIVGGESGSVNNSTNKGKVNSVSASPNAYAGGICGSSSSFTSIKNSHNSESVSAESTSSSSSNNNYVFAGGIAGYCGSTNSNMNCSNTGSVNASSASSSAFAGGIFGFYSGIYNSSVFFNTGEVSAVSGSKAAYAGGIYGANVTSCSTSNCYNTGSVSATASTTSYAGGISGCGGRTVSYSYNTGSVSASASELSNVYLGGLCGMGAASNQGVPVTIFGGDKSGIPANSYWNSESNQSINNIPLTIGKKGIGDITDTTTSLTSAQMRTQSPFVDWDFNGVWRIQGGVNNGYPTLRAF